VFEFTGKRQGQHSQQGQQGHKSQRSAFIITVEDITAMTMTRFHAVWLKFADVSEEHTPLELQQETVRSSVTLVYL